MATATEPGWFTALPRACAFRPSAATTRVSASFLPLSAAVSIMGANRRAAPAEGASTDFEPEASQRGRP